MREVARLAVCVDLRKPLISKLWIKGRLQRVEYEALSSICFQCGMVGHVTGLCMGAPTSAIDTSEGEALTKHQSGIEKKLAEQAFEEWMVVDCRKGRGRQSKTSDEGAVGVAARGSCFSALIGADALGEDEIRGKNGEKKLDADLGVMKGTTTDGLGIKEGKNKGKGKGKGIHIMKSSIKKRVVVGQPTFALKTMKPNVGRLDLQQNKKQSSMSPILPEKTDFKSRKNCGF